VGKLCHWICIDRAIQAGLAGWHEQLKDVAMPLLACGVPQPMTSARQ
jgi:hypothetical protein